MTINSGGDKRTLFITVGNVNWYSHSGNQDGAIICYSTIPSTPLSSGLTLSLHWETHAHLCLLWHYSWHGRRLWSQPRCLSTKEKLKKMYISTMEFYSARKKNQWNDDICRKIKEARNHCVKSSEPKLERQMLTVFLRLWNLDLTVGRLERKREGG